MASIALRAQFVGAFGLAAGGTSGPLLAADLAGSDAAAALPVGALAIGAAVIAPPLAAVMRDVGRGAGLAAGYAVAALAAAAVVVGAAADSLVLVLVASLVLGAGNAAVMLTRYAAIDAAPVAARGLAVSRSLLAMAVGAVAGPSLLAPSAWVAGAVGLPEPTGLHLVAVAVFAAAAVLARRAVEPVLKAPSPARGGAEPPASPRLAYAVLASANAVMVTVMAVATVHLRDHGLSLGAVGLVVSAHVVAMFAGGPFVGRLCDAVGPVRLARAGAVAFVAVGAAGALLGSRGALHTGVLLVVLGAAWNVQVVAGSVLLVAAVPPARRTEAEGRGELVMNLAAAGGSLLGAAPLTAVGGFRLLSTAVAAASGYVTVAIGRLDRIDQDNRSTTPMG